MTSPAYPLDGDGGWWDSLASTLDDARRAAWSVPDADYDRTTAECVALIEEWLPALPGRLIDIGCGPGRLTIPIAAAHPDAAVVGVDVAPRMLSLAACEAERVGVTNVEWRLGDGRTVPPGEAAAGAWTVVTFQHNPRDVCAAYVASVGAALAPGGRFVFQVVDAEAFEDETHLPRSVVEAWVAGAGLEMVEMLSGVVLDTTLWVIAEKP